MRFLAPLAFALCTLLGLPAFAADEVTVTRNVWLREGPSTSFAKIHKLLPHEEADLVQWNASGGYYKVRHEGEVGWVWGSNVWRYRDYDRDDWVHWIQDDDDCENVRDEVLIRDSGGAVTKAAENASGRCRVLTGDWLGPYTGLTFSESWQVQIDHMVPLKNAHISGGWEWSDAKKRQYANELSDELHLITVQGKANMEKSDQNPADWKPEREEFWCEYGTAWERIKEKWDLQMSPSERSAVAEMCRSSK